jgi:ubiquinone/menaquinone biosynthesis C-methylase UbiE
MDSRLQRRVQRYGWDLASDTYEPLWSAQLAQAQALMLALAAPAPGERVLDVACGTGLASFVAAAAVGEAGSVLGVDISQGMVDAAARRARERGVRNARFERMDAEHLDLPDASFDAALCGLGLMYVPTPETALRELRRVLRPGGRAGLAVWGERGRCGWSPVFEIVDRQVTSDVCPLFFRLGRADTLARACAEAGFEAIELRRIAVTLDYADGAAACDAAFVGGPVALAWSRFDEATRARARADYLAAIAPWRAGSGYRVPGEFVVVAGRVPAARAALAAVRRPAFTPVP